MTISNYKNDYRENSSEGFVPKTELGRQLWEIRKRIIASGSHMLDREEIEKENIIRRGGVGDIRS